MNLWGRLGISVTFIAGFCILMTEVFQDKGYYELYKWYICSTFLVTGLVVWLAGHFLNRRYRERMLAARQSQDPENSEEDEGGEQPSPFLLVNVAYWGVMLVVFGIIIVFIVPRPGEPIVVSARAATNSSSASQAVQTVEAPSAAAFPELRLQGIVYRQPNPSALINGRTYFVGDTVEGVEVREIAPDQVVVGRGDATQVLALTH